MTPASDVLPPIGGSKAYSKQLGLLAPQPPLFATRIEFAKFRNQAVTGPRGTQMAKIFAFVKFFKEEAHADSFLKGDLYMNRLSHFRSLEDASDAARPDRYEATAAWLQPANLKITFSQYPELKITGKNLAGPVSIAYNYHDRLHIFCMCTLSMDDPADYGQIEREEAENRINAHARLDDRCCTDFGAHAVFVSATPFFERFKAFAGSSGTTVSSNMVEYYDEKTHDGSFGFDEIPFRKQSAFSYQKEFRICIDTGVPGTDALHFDLGDISSFCAKLPAHQVNAAFQISVSEPE